MIASFKDEYRFLSNFAPANVVFEGLGFNSVEHAYVAAKTLNPIIRVCIASLEKPAMVKQAGKDIVLREDWEEVRLGIMEELVRQKFQNDIYALKLKATGTKEIVEGNYWHDNFWGSCTCERCGDKGENNLGKILMKIREELC